jgi:T-complex protein 1 subunit theta
MAKSMAFDQASGITGMLKDGHKHIEGIDDAIVRNLEAGKQLATIVHTSLGPNGMKKLVINHLDKIVVTSDCATIVNELEVQHPAAKLLVHASEMQSTEIGDGTNLVVSFAGELLKLSEDLLRMGLHPSEIIRGYKTAQEKCFEILPTLESSTLRGKLRNKKELIKILKPVIGAKQYGYEDTLSNLVADACLDVMTPTDKINVDNIRVAKIMGGHVRDSLVFKGMVIQRDSQGTIERVENAKIAVYSCGVELSGTEAQSVILIRTAEELLNYTKSEENKMEEIVKGIADSGINVVISGGSISEVALHYLENYGIMSLKIASKWDLRRICSAVNATALVRLGPPTPEEMGHCSLAYVRELGGKQVTIFQQNQGENSRLATIVLRASTESLLSDLERAVDNGVMTIKHLSTNPEFVPGAGACEIELAHQIIRFGETSPGLEQYAIRQFARAFEVIPRTLAENNGMDATRIVTELYAAHANGERAVGVDLENNVIANTGVQDLMVSKKNAIRLATDAALTVLRVDQLIMSKPAGGPKAPQQGANDS